MSTTAIINNRSQSAIPLGTLKMRGEDFIVMKKEYLDELIILMKSVAAGEKLLNEGKTRSFSAFLKSLSKSRR